MTLAILLAALLSSWATAQINLQLAPGNSCLVNCCLHGRAVCVLCFVTTMLHQALCSQEPSLVKGHLHIVIAGYKYDTCFDTWLWGLGTTNADVSHSDATHRRAHNMPASCASGKILGQACAGQARMQHPMYASEECALVCFFRSHTIAECSLICQRGAGLARAACL